MKKTNKIGENMKKIIYFLLTLSVIFFVSCTKDDTDNELKFWTVFAGPDGNNMNKLVSDYNATNPTMKIVHVPMPENDLYGKIATVVNAGKGMPDFGVIHINRIGSFVKNDLIVPLDDYLVAQNAIKQENYLQVAWKGGDINGKQYSIPLDIHSFLLYYNEDLLQKYAPNVFDDGVLSFQEIAEVGKKASADNIGTIGLTWWRVLFLSWYAQLGGKLGDSNDAPSFNNEKAKQVLNQMKSLVASGLTQQEGEDSGQLFRSGNMIFWPEGSWMINSLKEIEELNFKTTYLPVFPPKIKKDWTSSHQMVIYKQEMSDEKAQAILDFMAWIGDNSLEWANAGHVPANLKIKDTKEFSNMPQAFLADDENALSINRYKYYGYAAEALDKIIPDVSFGKISVEEALSKAEKEVNDRIAVE